MHAVATQPAGLFVPISAAQRAQVLRNRLILIVETDDLIGRLLDRWLGEAGFDVQAGTIEFGHGGAPNLPPDLVIVNIADPRSAGALIRSLELHFAAPVLVVSARFRLGLAMSPATARRFGVRTVLPKPFTREELLSAVAESMRRPEEPGT